MRPEVHREPRVGVVARPGDPCVELVARALAARGAELIRLPLDRFPHEVTTSISLGDSESTLEFGVDLGALRALWIRHAAIADPPPSLPEEDRAACAGQCEAAAWAALGCFDGYVLDPVEALHAAPSKPRQLQLAARCGLDIPRTLVTNDPAAVRRFAARHPGGVACKLIASGALALADDAGATRVFPTTRLAPDDIADLAGLAASPMIFQELLPKALEARVTVVGREVFVAAVAPGDVVDVRTDPSLLAALRPYDGVPPAVRDALLRLLDGLGLDFATADLVRTPDGRWVFLEVNTVSFFDHVERAAGLPISDAVAGLLLGLRPSRVR